MKKYFFYTCLLCAVFSSFSCSNEPVEFTLDNQDELPGTIDDDIDNPIDSIYATAKLDGQDFYANQFEIDTMSSEKLKVSFLSDLEQQLFLILPNPIETGTYTIDQNNDEQRLYSGAFINSVGNISETIFYSMPDSGEISITSYNSQTGDFSGIFEFDVATLNNNTIIITEGEFDLTTD